MGRRVTSAWLAAAFRTVRALSDGTSAKHAFETKSENAIDRALPHLSPSRSLSLSTRFRSPCQNVRAEVGESRNNDRTGCERVWRGPPRPATPRSATPRHAPLSSRYSPHAQVLPGAVERAPTTPRPARVQRKRTPPLLKERTWTDCGKKLKKK